MAIKKTKDDCGCGKSIKITDSQRKKIITNRTIKKINSKY